METPFLETNNVDIFIRRHDGFFFVEAIRKSDHNQVFRNRHLYEEAAEHESRSLWYRFKRDE